jgi:hypothetical protein
VQACDTVVVAASTAGQEKKMAKSKEDAKAEGYKRGLEGKVGTAGLTQGWSDDKAAGLARSDGYMEGKRKRAQKATKDKK